MGGHVEAFSDFSSAVLDSAFEGELATVTVEGGNACQCNEAFTVEFLQFAQVGLRA